MNVRLFERWDWEHDLPISEIDRDQPLPRSHAVVYYDDRDLPFRVVNVNPDDFVRLSDALEHAEDERDVYDYFYDATGRLSEKRSLDEFGNVCLIVRMEYTGDKRCAEVAWNPQCDDVARRINLSSR